ncbi:MAG: hypothetical protein NTW19_04920 [Planctomycetota bacterium]|nr:hypothetical protein [Planctomycetota bacterium]
MATEIKTAAMIAFAVIWYVACHLISTRARKAEIEANSEPAASALFSWIAPMGVIAVIIAVVMRWV